MLNNILAINGMIKINKKILIKNINNPISKGSQNL